MKIHIGNIIRLTAEKQGRSSSWLANEINTGKRNIYALFRREDISTIQLYKLSKALNTNFFELYKDLLNLEMNNNPEMNLVEKEKEEDKPRTDEKTLRVGLSIQCPISSTNELGKFMEHLSTVANLYGLKVE